MKEIMHVEDAFSVKDIGVIVSGRNPIFESMTTAEIKFLVGSRVRIAEDSFEVKDVVVSESFLGKKNVSIALAGDTQVARGSILYSLS
ncbi:MAG: hypothetical protein COA95_11580 [Methylophaga sp.]|nr:MAG: hypothetical protein COA95_11580 [Methylophaga sp.]